MTLTDLLAQAARGIEARDGVSLPSQRLSGDTRRRLGEAVAGRLVVAVGGVVAEGHLSATGPFFRRRDLATALLAVAELCALYGVTANEMARVLGTMSDD